VKGIWVLALFLAVTPVMPALAQVPSPITSVGDTMVVTIAAVPGFRFDRVRFQVEPDRPIRLTLNNADAESEMPHNLVVTSPGAREIVVAAGMQMTPERHYVPDLPQVLAFTPLLGEGESFVLRFDAPEQPGEYPFVCTFPGHGFSMYGVMYVGRPMPPITQDENVPPAQRTAAGAGEGPPPLSTRQYPGLSYGTEFPAISRTFLAENGPASIAVGLTPEHAYNFDAGGVYLASAWTGGFVDNQPHWRGNGNAYAIVEGSIYYRNTSGFPLRIGDRDREGEVAFRGYRLVDGGYPEFSYSVDGVAVHELIMPLAEGVGLTRRFHIESDEPVRFHAEVGSGVRFESNVGRWNGGILELTPEQAREFVVTMVLQAEADR
jgi:azurin